MSTITEDIKAGKDAKPSSVTVCFIEKFDEPGLYVDGPVGSDYSFIKWRTVPSAITIQEIGELFQRVDRLEWTEDAETNYKKDINDILNLHLGMIQDNARHIERLEMHTGLLPKWAGACEEMKKSKKQDMFVFEVQIYREGNWFVAKSRNTDIVSEGETVEKAFQNFKEAAALWLETASEQEVHSYTSWPVDEDRTVYRTSFKMPKQ